jgi:hypothetical protein
MVKKFFITAMLLLITISFAFAGSKPNIQEGLWEITSTVRMQGMQMPPMIHQQCLSEKDLVPQSKQPGQECTVTDVKVVGDTVSWKISCTGQGGDMKGSGAITYKGSSFEGTMTLTVGDTGMTMTMNMSGRRIGKCNK